MYPSTPEQVKDLIGKVIVFNQNVIKTEIDFEPGMKARVIDYEIIDNDVFCLTTNFDEFEDHNKKLMMPNYYNKDGIACLKWDETPYYPENGITKDYFGFMGEGMGEGSNCFEVE